MNSNQNNILKAFNFRYACKEFDLDKKISEEDFNFLLEVGRLSPSSFGFEPWKFLIIQNMNLREKLKEFTWGGQRQLPSASHFIIFLARKAIDTKHGSDYTNHIMKNIQNLPSDIINMKSSFYKNFQQIDFDLNNNRTLFDWSCKQVYIPLGNMMSSAAQIGIDSCPIEGFNRDKIDQLLIDEGLIDSNHFSASAMVAFGYRADSTTIREKTRQSLDEITKWVY